MFETEASVPRNGLEPFRKQPDVLRAFHGPRIFVQNRDSQPSFPLVRLAQHCPFRFTST